LGSYTGFFQTFARRKIHCYESRRVVFLQRIDGMKKHSLGPRSWSGLHLEKHCINAFKHFHFSINKQPINNNILLTERPSFKEGTLKFGTYCLCSGDTQFGDALAYFGVKAYKEILKQVLAGGFRIIWQMFAICRG
jgi:hypothetical protein